MPPTRFRVIERDRRLVVVDTRAGESMAVSTQMPATGGNAAVTLHALAERAGLPLPTRTRFDGSATLTTAAWYDDNGPRTVTLDPGAMQMVKLAVGAAVVTVVVAGLLAPALFFTPLTLLLPGVAKPLRERVTGWLDQYAA